MPNRKIKRYEIKKNHKIDSDAEIAKRIDAFEAAMAAQTMGARIKALRKAKRLTQYELARKVGVSPQAVCQWESETTLTIKTEAFIRLVEALETDYVFLCWGNDKIPPLVKRSKTHP